MDKFRIVSEIFKRALGLILNLAIFFTFTFAESARALSNDFKFNQFSKTSFQQVDLKQALKNSPTSQKLDQLQSLLEFFDGPEEEEEELKDDKPPKKKCWEQGETPDRGKEHKCCGDLLFYDGICTVPPKLPRKRCGPKPGTRDKYNEGTIEDGDHGQCDPSQACIPGDAHDLYDDSDKSDKDILKMEQEQSSVGAKLKNGLGKLICFNHRQCISRHCTKVEGKSGLAKALKKIASVKKCVDQTWVCRCLDMNERAPRNKPGAKCCPGLVKDPEGWCIDPLSQPMMILDGGPSSPKFDKLGCAPNFPNAELFKLIKNTSKVRAFEWATATSGNTNRSMGKCKTGDNMSINHRLKEEYGLVLKQKRIEIEQKLEARIKELKVERNKLVNARFSAHQVISDEDRDKYEREQAQANDRITGYDMIRLMQKEQEILRDFEKEQAHLYTEMHNVIASIKKQWDAIKPKSKGGRCRGIYTGWPFNKQKNKRRWQWRYKVKAKKKGNKDFIFNDSGVLRALIENGAMVGKKGKYFLHDPLMPGPERFDKYGTKPMLIGKGYRRTLGWDMLVVAIIIIVATGGAALFFSPWTLMLTAAVMGAGMFNKASKKEKGVLFGIKKDMTPNIIKYFSTPPLRGDKELGIDYTCLKTKFEQDGSQKYQDDATYVDATDYFSARQKVEEIAKKRAKELGQELEYGTVQDLGTDVESKEFKEEVDKLEKEMEQKQKEADANENEEVIYEEEQEDDEGDIDEVAEEDVGEEDDINSVKSKEKIEGIVENERGGSIKDGDYHHKKPCMRSVLMIKQLSDTAFAQFIAQAKNLKRTIKTFDGNDKSNHLGMMITDLQSLALTKNLIASYRDASIQCLENKLTEYKWDGSKGVIANADEYKNKQAPMEWQNSKQASIKCKNCDLKGGAKAIGVKIGTTSNSTNLDGKLDIEAIIRKYQERIRAEKPELYSKYAAVRKQIDKRNEAILKKDPKALEKAQQYYFLNDKYSYADNRAISAATGLPIPAKYDQKLSDLKYQNTRGPQSEFAKEEKKEEEEPKLSLDSGKAKTKVVPKVDKKKLEKDAADAQAELDSLFDDTESEIKVDKDGEYEEAKTYTSLDDKQRKRVLKYITKQKITSMPDFTLFQKVSRAYVRSAYPVLLDPKARKRKPAQVQKIENVDDNDPIKKKLLERLNKFNLRK